MIIVITTRVENLHTHKPQTVASHGIDLDTHEQVVLPCDTPENLGAHYDSRYGEFVIPDRKHPVVR